MTRDELLAAYAKGERNFRHANIGGADLRDAYLSGANLSGADLSGTDLRSAYLRSALNAIEMGIVINERAGMRAPSD